MPAHQHLTRAQLRRLRVELEHELAWLERATRLEREHDAGVPRYSEDDSTGHGGLAVALDSHARTRRAEVRHALERMSTGAYGDCGRCGGAIPYDRLLVVPEAAHCISCGAFS